MRAALAAALIASTPALATPGPATFSPAASSLGEPVDVQVAPGAGAPLFVVEQAGRVRVVQEGALLAAPFLDFTSRVLAGGEQGAFSIAFHPRYGDSGRFFLLYTAPRAGGGSGNDVVVASGRRSATDALRAEPALSEVLRVPHPTYANHNGGRLAFGPDGFLYVSIGDGGGGGDPDNLAQDLGDLRGKILRLDVDGASPYAIPPANPFVAHPGARGEIFAYGLRNPWRIAFDRATGDLYIGDVGQNALEEIDVAPAGSAGQNFGWRVFEGTRCHEPPTSCALAGHVPPVLEYGRDANGGFSVTGGHVYRGRAWPELRGWYVYGDYVTGRIWAAKPPFTGGHAAAVHLGTRSAVSTFGEDAEGELLVADRDAGTLYRLGPADADGDGLSDAFEAAHFGSATAGNADADEDGDQLSNLDEYREGRSPAARDNDVFGDARLFALQQYRDFLGRRADEAGAAFWTGLLERGERTRDEVARDFLASPEFEGAGAPVVRLYFAYFLRIPDAPGLTFWMARARSGEPTASISEFFAGSPEFTQRYGSLDDGAFVDRIYANVLGRAPDAEGRAFWTARLASGDMTRGEVMLAFSESPEYRAAIGSEVFVTMAYLGMLRRAPEPEGFAFWVRALDEGADGAQLLGGFIGSPEYRARFLP